MVSIALLIRIQADVDEVFGAVASPDRIGGWFTPATSLNPEDGGDLTLHFPEGETHFAISKRLPGSEIVWTCTDTRHIWSDTQIQFRFEQNGAKTIVRFDHAGWKEASDTCRDCAMSWAYFLESLKSFLETGTGTPENVAPPCERAKDLQT